MTLCFILFFGQFSCGMRFSSDAVSEAIPGTFPVLHRRGLLCGRKPHHRVVPAQKSTSAKGCFRFADLYVSHLSRGRTLFLTRYGGARKNRSTRFLARTSASRR